MLVLCVALLLGALIAVAGGLFSPRGRWLVAAAAPAVVCYAGVGMAGWYVTSFVVKPNELVREQPYIAYNIEMTRQAYGLDRFLQSEFPAETTVDAADPANNQSTLKNIRLWDWHALQDTLRQMQEIRTYYDFPDIDIDRYEINGSMREVMLAARELNVDKLPESSRNWINDKLIYTHGYGITMNPVNGFTPEGLPTLLLSNMPVQSTVPGLDVTRPEIYFGEHDQHRCICEDAAAGVQLPAGRAATTLPSMRAMAASSWADFCAASLIAFDRGDLAKLPFSDDVNAQSRLLMRRTVRERVAALAPFLTFDQDPYIVLGDDGRLSWILDAFTQSDTYPYSTHYSVNGQSVNYMRNSVKVVVDAYNGTTTFYVFDKQDPILAAYRGIFPEPVQGRGDRCRPGCASMCATPNYCSSLQAEVYGLVSHDQSRGLLQPGRLMDGGDGGWHGRGAVEPADAADAAELRADEAARRERRRVCGDSALHAGQSQQPDWLDCGAQRRRALWHFDCLRLSQDEAGGWAIADRGAHRSERADFRAS